jgi:membrane-bound lytic murein transglycosylase A
MARLWRGPAVCIAAAVLLTGCAVPTAAPPAGSGTGAGGSARWVATDWAALPGWSDDRALELWPAFTQSCQRPPKGWAETCARALLEAPADDTTARESLMRWLQPWRVEAANGSAEGLATGYFEPMLEASRMPGTKFSVPLYTPPGDLKARQPHWTRQELDMLPAARAAMRGREIAWIEDPIDLLVLQIQGSGRLRITEANGRVQLLRVAFAGHNGHPYRSPGQWLVDQGAVRPGAASWAALRAWAAQNPQRLQELLWANPRVVYFRPEPLPDPAQGPRGAQGVPLTPGRSVAVDPAALPYGTPLWIDTTQIAQGAPPAPLRRLVMAQDTGSAITGAVRIDYFWGWGEAAQAQASRMKNPLRLWALWPRGLLPPAP